MNTLYSTHTKYQIKIQYRLAGEEKSTIRVMYFRQEMAVIEIELNRDGLIVVWWMETQIQMCVSWICK